jgi:hypothetical protein
LRPKAIQPGPEVVNGRIVPPHNTAFPEGHIGAPDIANQIDAVAEQKRNPPQAPVGFSLEGLIHDAIEDSEIRN